MRADLSAFTVAIALLAALGARRHGLSRRLPSRSPASEAEGRCARRRRALVERVGRRRRRRRVIEPEAVAAWCDELSRQTRAGCSLAAALTEARPNDPVLLDATDGLRRALTRGRSIDEAVSIPLAGAVDVRRGSHHLALACSTIAVSARVGGTPSAPLDRVASSLRLRAVDRDERATQAAQAQMSAHVLTALPVGMLALLVATDPDVRLAVTGPIGGLCVVVGVALNVTGFVWMHRTIEGAT